jgi:hypothetical protein
VAVAGSFAGALRTAVLQGRHQMVLYLVQDKNVQDMLEPEDLEHILHLAVRHTR